ncbi:MAG: energy-coupling factor ABC transporter ATP-binding protein [Oscillospiraceae bacterium]|nr:energy-coupling factor ABC transporter ATP-binding protein [Oscillospiraceae bacterium]
MEILKVENLNFSYPLTASPVIKNVTFSVNKGEFIAVCGVTGSGKSTLLRLLKPELSPIGEISGERFFDNVPVNKLAHEKSASGIGFVMQNPEHQLVTDTVWHELAFGLENLNISQAVMARRIAETAAYFGIEDWYDKKVSELSGGQKQLLCLAAVMVMNPQIIVLDEPTSRLDPIAASEFIATLKKLNRELSLTVIISEHRLEEVIPVCDKLLVLENGSIKAFSAPKNVVPKLDEALLRAMPAAVQLFRAAEGRGECPLDIRDGKRFVEANFSNHIRSLPDEEYVHSKSAAMRFRDVYFRYERNLPDVLKGLNMTVYENEIFCILGGNGSGKTTTLSAAAKLVKPYSGTIEIFGRRLKDYKNQTLYCNCLTLLPQDVQTVFMMNTVRQELEGAELDAFPFDFDKLMDKHPYDLSGGEQQLVALAKVLAANPKLLLLDEPTKGIDADSKHRLVLILKKLKADGMTIVIVTHDTEFACACADRCAMMFRGEIVSEAVPRQFFSENNFYTTAVSRITRGFYSNAVSLDDAVRLWKLNKGGEKP